MIKIPAGTYRIGTDTKAGFEEDQEGPKIQVEMASFEIDETTVTNQMFEAFIAATGYVTEAEQFGWSFVFHYFLSEKTKQRSQLIPNMSWWYILKVRTHRLSNGWIIQSSKSREMMRWHFAAGQISGCQQKLNGRLPRKVVQRMTYIHGGQIF